MYLIGIDISKFKHNCFIATEAGDVIKEFIFDNSTTGFKEFLDVLNTLDHSNEIRIGLEATGHYGYNLKHFIISSGFSFYEFNPYQVYLFSKASTLRKTKTDKVDAKTISRMLGSVYYKTHHSKSYHINDLKSLVRERDNLISLRSKSLVRLTNHLDAYFPEYKPFFNNIFGKTAIFILKTYKTRDKISKLNMTHYEKLRCLSRGKLSYPKFRKLTEAANSSIGVNSKSKEFLIQTTITHYLSIDSLLQSVENEILEMMASIDTKLNTVPGLGLVSIATIIGEVGSFDNFTSPEKLIAFAGLDVSISQSGISEHHGKIVRRGSSLLRKTFWNYAFLSIKFIPSLNDYYHKKKSEGKHHKVILTQIARKLVRMIYHIGKFNIDFKY